MKALVLGAGGQLGRALVATCPDDMACVALDRSRLDLTDEQAIRQTLRTEHPDIVVNAAAYTAVDRAESDEDLAFAINARAVETIAQTLAETGGKLVHVSTDYVFDGMQSRPYRPEDQRNPLSVYGRSKAMGEDCAGANATIVRSSWVYSAGSSNFVCTMLRVMRERNELRVVADQIGAPTWASGLARTIWALGRTGKPGIYHHRDAGVASWYDFAVAIGEEALALDLVERVPVIVPIETRDYPAPAARPAFSLLDDTATRVLLGDQPPHWRENLRAMLRQEKALG